MDFVSEMTFYHVKKRLRNLFSFLGCSPPLIPSIYRYRLDSQTQTFQCQATVIVTGGLILDTSGVGNLVQKTSHITAWSSIFPHSADKCNGRNALLNSAKLDNRRYSGCTEQCVGLTRFSAVHYMQAWPMHLSNKPRLVETSPRSNDCIEFIFRDHFSYTTAWTGQPISLLKTSSETFSDNKWGIMSQ